jgi:hypothetical protein
VGGFWYHGCNYWGTDVERLIGFVQEPSKAIQTGVRSGGPVKEEELNRERILTHLFSLIVPGTQRVLCQKRRFV